MIGGTLNTAVPASVVVCPIAVVFSVFVVVLAIIGDEVVEGEAVVTRHKINTLFGFAFFMAVNCRATKQTISKAPDTILFSAKETPDIISKPPIPLSPTVSDKGP